jgi:signal transduction histidine kinase
VPEETTPRTDEADELEHWRERVFRFVLILTIAFALPALLLWSYSKAEQQRFLVALPAWAVYGVFVVLGVARRVAWRTRALVFLFCLFASGAVPIFEYGFRSQGPLLLLAAITAGSVFLGVRASLTLLALALAVIGCSGVLFLTGTLRDNASHPLTSVVAWTAHSGTFLFIGVCMVATVGVLMRRLEASLAKTRGLVRELRREVSAVEAEKSATERELGERKRAEALVAQRDSVLRAVAGAAAQLLARRRWEDSALQIITNLGEAAGVARVTLAELVTDPERGELLRVRYWKAWGEPHWADRAGLRELSVRAAALEPFVARLREGQAALVKLDELPEAPRRLARELSMAVGIALPIAAGDELWGFIGFESSEPAFELSEPLSDMLRAAAGSLGAAIARDRLETELEERVLERTQRLARANEDLKAFSFTISHDLRAPLRQVSAYVGMLRESAGERLDGDAGRYLASIDEATRRMGGMIEDLLRFYATAWSELSLARVDLGVLVHELIADLGTETRGRDARFELEPLPTLVADRALLKHALANLLGNALKYTRPRATAKIRVFCTHADGQAVIAVQDNGVGFDPTYQQRLFQVFQRLHPASEFEGNGIGLAHVKRIVERHGGRVWAEGAPDRGATFYVALPELAGGGPPDSGAPPVPGAVTSVK